MPNDKNLLGEAIVAPRIPRFMTRYETRLLRETMAGEGVAGNKMLFLDFLQYNLGCMSISKAIKASASSVE